MKKLYEKSEIWFAVAWIIVYVVVMGNLRGNFGDESLYSMLAALVMAVVLTVFMVRNRRTGSGLFCGRTAGSTCTLFRLFCCAP